MRHQPQTFTHVRKADMAATALRPVDAFDGLQDAAGQTVRRALIHANAIVSDFNTHHTLPFASAQPDEAAVLLLADAMFDRVLDDRLHSQGGKPVIDDENDRNDDAGNDEWP